MNKIIRTVTLLLFVLSLAAALPAMGRRAEVEEIVTPEENAVLVQVSGRVRLVGNDPFYELVITGEELEWYIARDEFDKLMELQQRTVTVEGFETVRELRFASGISAGERRTLKNILIIAVE